jgi:signal transduction histidine kinase
MRSFQASTGVILSHISFKMALPAGSGFGVERAFRIASIAFRRQNLWRPHWSRHMMQSWQSLNELSSEVIRCPAALNGSAGDTEKQAQNGELLRSNARITEFAHAVAHDLREPLRTISMFSELLIHEAVLDAQGKQFAQLIVDGIARMSALFEGLRSFAISGHDEPSQPVDLTHVLTNVMQDLGHALAASGAVVTVDPMPIVCGNESHLSRVFQNLLANAIKYRSDAPVEIHVTATRLGADWVIKVHDNGVGVAPEHHDRIFELFQRLHGPEVPGAGVGLAICKKVVEAMGGAIWVESELMTGSTFCFRIPGMERIGVDTAAGADPRRDEMRAGSLPVFSQTNPLHAPITQAASK